MKRSKTLFGALLSALAITAVSCTTEPLNPEQTVQEGLQTRTVTLSAAIADADTKAAIDNAGVFSWKADDAIAVYTSEGRFVKFTLKEGAGEKSAKFEGTLAAEETVGNIAVYPYSEALKLDGNNLTVNLPAQLDYVDGETHSAPMLAKIDGENPSSLSFKHLGGFMRFNVTNVPLGADTFVLTTDKKITGDFVVDVTADTPVLITEPSSNSNTFTYKVTAPSVIKTTATYLIPVPATDYCPITVKYVDQYGYDMNGQEISTNPGVVDEESPENNVPAVTNTVARASLIDMPELNNKSSLPAPKNVKTLRNEHNIVVFSWDRSLETVEGAVITDVPFADWCDQRFEHNLYEVAQDGTRTEVKYCDNYRTYAGNKFYRGNVISIGLGNLKAETNYIFRIRTCGKDKEAKTNRSAYSQIEFTTPAKPVDGADVIYSERFDNFVFGPDLQNAATGWTSTDAEITAATSIADLDKKNTLRYPWTQYSYSNNNIADASKFVRATIDEMLPNTYLRAMFCQLGYMLFGNSGGSNGQFKTPALSKLTEPSTIKVELDACKFVMWENGAKKSADDNAKLNVAVGSNTQSVENLNEDWTHYEFTFENVTPKDVVFVSSTVFSNKNKRLYVDNIVVTKVTE